MDPGSQPSDAVVDSELPYPARLTFDTARWAGPVMLYSKDDKVPIDALRSHSAVGYRGEYYALGWSHVDEPWFFVGIFRLPLSLIEGIVLVVGTLPVTTEELRPVTPNRTLAIPPLLVATPSVLGIVGWLRLDRYILEAPLSGLLVSIPLLGFALLGAVLRHRDRRMGLLVGVCTVISVAMLLIPATLELDFSLVRMNSIFAVVLGPPTTTLTQAPTDPESESGSE